MAPAGGGSICTNVLLGSFYLGSRRFKAENGAVLPEGNMNFRGGGMPIVERTQELEHSF